MKQQKHEYPDGAKEWILSGDKGAVNFLVFPVPEGGWRQPCVIGIHGLAKFGRDQHKGKCDILGKCYPDQTFQHADELWHSSKLGTNDQHIWIELAHWYDSRLGKLTAEIKEA
jgi:hypothetical protein